MQGRAEQTVEQDVAILAIEVAHIGHPLFQLDMDTSPADAIAAAARTKFDCTAPVISTVSAASRCAAPK